MTGAELLKLRWALRLLASGRPNDAREELLELERGELSLRGAGALTGVEPRPLPDRITRWPTEL